MAELPESSSELSVPQLKDHLCKRNLSKKGNKDILLASIKSHIKKSEAISEKSDSEKTSNMNSDPQVELNKKRGREKSFKISIDSLLKDLTNLCTLENKQAEIASRL